MNLWEDLLSNVERSSGKAALVEGDRVHTFREVEMMAGRLGDAVAGATKKDAVGIFLPTGTGFVLSFYGLMKHALAAVPFNLLAAPRDLAFVAADAGIDTIVTSTRFVGDLKPLGLRLVTLEEVLDFGGNERPASTPPARGAARTDDLATILYTSGTSGTPKGVRLTHGNILSNVRASVQAIRIEADDVVIGMLPMFHTFALTVTMGVSMHAGGTFVFQSPFNPEAALRSIQRHRVSLLIAVPGMHRVLSLTAQSGAFDTSSLRVAISGGEALPRTVERRFKEVFGIDLLQGYGLTEASPVVAVNPREANRSGTVGLPLPGLSVGIVDENGRELQCRAVGELCVKGPSIMEGYHNRPDLTAAAIRHGRLHTGDMAFRDEDGYITITGRKDDMIVVSGENVFPAEIEMVMDEHPHVARSAVIAREDEGKGTVLTAVIVPAVEHPDRASIRRHLLAVLPPHKVPKVIEFRKEVPVSATGKIIKRGLR